MCTFIDMTQNCCSSLTPLAILARCLNSGDAHHTLLHTCQQYLLHHSSHLISSWCEGRSGCKCSIADKLCAWILTFDSVGTSLDDACVLQCAAMIEYDGIEYPTPRHLLAAARADHPQLPVSSAWNAITYCGVSLEKLRLRGHKLWAEAKTKFGFIGRHLQDSSASGVDTDREP